MAARPQLVAVDTNVLLDLANNEEVVIDAIATLRQRVKPVKFVATPTVLQELANLVDHGDTPEIRRVALSAAKKFHEVWQFEPTGHSAVAHGIAGRIAVRLRDHGLLPAAEVHASLVLAQAALPTCVSPLPSAAQFLGSGHRAPAR